ncbi:hypothetical protein BC939DRAFT_435088 [Gamsiella multidivaricata]|uniref:uncharacterized protein n=1 Tax=Gamsiella multidivaricata TaxID=101098 RepID=UPI002220DC4C|nr:uncharacterized protein BC939DRAFT_435088 [Gamsiella multidivaricata]KAI7832287.1 hypothetical protein BC939DRAFT_435088 [Gamsiella multidivaricata]
MNQGSVDASFSVGVVGKIVLALLCCEGVLMAALVGIQSGGRRDIKGCGDARGALGGIASDVGETGEGSEAQLEGTAVRVGSKGDARGYVKGESSTTGAVGVLEPVISLIGGS